MIRRKLSGEKYYMMGDHLGSVSSLTNASGSVIETTLYEPFGGIESGGEKSRFDYEGKEFDEVVNQRDFGFRMQSGGIPEIFIQPDSLIQNVYDPQMLNRYSFERGNPYKYVDEDGHVFQWAAVIYWGIELTANIGLFVGSVIYSKQVRDESNKLLEPISTENVMHVAESEKAPNVMREATDAEKEAMRKVRDGSKEDDKKTILKIMGIINPLIKERNKNNRI